MKPRSVMAVGPRENRSVRQRVSDVAMLAVAQNGSLAILPIIISRGLGRRVYFLWKHNRDTGELRTDDSFAPGSAENRKPFEPLDMAPIIEAS